MKRFTYLKRIVPLLVYCVIMVVMAYYIISGIMEVQLMKLFYTMFILSLPVIIYIFFSKKKIITVALLIAMIIANVFTFPFAGGAFYKSYSHINYYFPPLPKQKYTRDHFVFMEKYLDSKTVYYSQEDFINRNYYNHSNVFYQFTPDKYTLVYQPETLRTLDDNQIDYLLNEYNFYEFYHTTDISYYFYVEDNFETCKAIVVYLDENDNAYFFPLDIEKEL